MNPHRRRSIHQGEMPLHNAQTYKAFQTTPPLLVYAYCYIMQESWRFYNTNHVTQASEDLAPNKILSDPCSPLLSFYKEMASAKEKIDKCTIESIKRI